MASPKLSGPGDGLLVRTGPVGLGGLPGSVYAGRPPSLRNGHRASGAGGLDDIFETPAGDEIPGTLSGGDIGDNVGLLVREAIQTLSRVIDHPSKVFEPLVSR